MRVSVIGTGYVGLVSGLCLAEMGHHVVCVDRDAEKVAAINAGRCPIHEDGLGTLLNRNLGDRFSATTDLVQAVRGTELSLIAVGTPFDGQRIDLSYVIAVAAELGEVLRNKDARHTVVVKSTVVPGTTDGPVRTTLEQHAGKRAGVDFGLGMNPEFLREGEAVGDFMHPDRIVVGGVDEASRDTLAALYAPFGSVDVLRTNNRTAEMIKYASNSLLATLISFSNEIANLCAVLPEVDVVDVLEGVRLDRRISPIDAQGVRTVPPVTSYLAAGCGFGGSCFPKDVKALVAHGQQHGLSMDLLASVVAINERQPARVLGLLAKHLGSLQGVRVALLGLAFKPGTDDMRESPAIPIVRALLAAGAQVSGYDPVAQEEARKVLGDKVRYCDDLAVCVQDVDALVVVTRWDEFANLPALLADRDPQPLVVDGRRMLPRDAVSRYDGIGLGHTIDTGAVAEVSA